MLSADKCEATLEDLRRQFATRLIPALAK